MTWGDFKTEVRTLLLAYATTDGVQDYIDRQILAGIVDLQRTIPFYQIGHQDVLTENDSISEGSTSRFAMPNGRIESVWLRFNETASEEDASVLVSGGGAFYALARGRYVWNDLASAYVIEGGGFTVAQSSGRWVLNDEEAEAVLAQHTTTGVEFPWQGEWEPWDFPAETNIPTISSYSPDVQVELGLSQVGGDEFRAMIGGDTDRKGRVFIDTKRAVFYVTPALNPETLLVLRWSGVKTSFEDEDETKFDGEAVHAVSEFVLSRLIRSVDKDLRQAQAHEEAYVTLKRKLFSDFNARSFVQTNSRTVGYRAADL